MRGDRFDGGAARRLLRNAWARLREFHANQVELTERHQLVNQPWEEEFLPWSRSGDLHGSYVPPCGRRRGTTRVRVVPRECADAGECGD